MLVANISNKEITQFSDHELIDLALAGNERAYTVLFSRYQRVVEAMVTRYLQHEQDITEAVQDTFIRAFKALGRFRRACKFSSWLCKIAISVAIDRFRSNQQRNKRETSDGDWEVSFRFLKAAEVDRTEQRDFVHWVQQAVATLAQSDGDVIQLFYLQEQSIDEICALSGLTASNVKSRLSRARVRLRKIIEERFAQELLN